PNTDWQAPRQRKLVKWLVFCDAWPHLVDDVLTRNEGESTDCLRELANKLETHGKNSRNNLPYLKNFPDFINLNADDVLSDTDLDDDFKRAAYLSQLIRESPEISPLRNGSVGNAYGTSFLL
ncbi:MAG: hypothetical protein WAM70_02935, partial [Pyrinomonadaceae bacterium]